VNYLAHAYFSNGDENLLLGNFMADHIRGNHFEHLSEEIKQGIHLHRAIDSFTDEHAAFKKSKRVFYDGYERYSGILVDIYFDHFLASNFASYSGTPLVEFTSKVYTVYQNNRHVLPETGNGFLNYVIQNDIYNAYAKIEGIERVLYHLSRRIGHNIMLDGSVTIYKQNEALLHEQFGELINDGIARFIKD
jgi:acyl carrier protein phosphodiesterase